MKRVSETLLALLVAFVALQTRQAERGQTMFTDSQLEQKAFQLAREILILDTHIDLPYRLTTRLMEDISLRTQVGEFDYPRAREGGLDVAFMAIYVPASFQTTNGGKKLANELIDLVEGFVRQWPEKFALARSVSDVQSNFGNGLLSLPLGIENGAALEGRIENLEHFFRRGVRYITLVHGKNNRICDSSYDAARTWHGLSPFGVAVIEEMNRLGIMVDVSHASDEAFYQTVQRSRAPVIASHSSCRHFTPGWERNMSDDMIRTLAKEGGVIQINFGSTFLSRLYRETTDREAALLRRRNLERHSPEAREFLLELRAKNPPPQVTIADVVAHIEHVVNLVGIDHVGLGSDFDGVGGELPTGLNDVSCYPNLLVELLKRGYSTEDLRKICSGNLLRVWQDVEDVAENLNEAG